jgi:hypothetical protein
MLSFLRGAVVSSELQLPKGDMYGGRDIKSVQISDGQDSSILYSSSVAVSATWDPYVGEGLCASRGLSDPPWKCGVVQDDFHSWSGAPCNCTTYGGDSSILFEGGDSGSPIVDAYSQYAAIGIAVTDGGLFVRIDDALNAWGYQLRQ